MIVYFSSRTGNTKRFIDKLDCDRVIEISENLDIDEPYVLFTGTYARNDGSGAVHPSVIKFLNKNRHHIKAVIGGGNRNFGNHFGFAADVISHKCSVPVLYKFELFGNNEDVEKVNNILKELEL